MRNCLFGLLFLGQILLAKNLQAIVLNSRQNLVLKLDMINVSFNPV